MQRERSDSTSVIGVPAASRPAISTGLQAGGDPVVLYAGKVVRLPLVNRLVPLVRLQLGLALVVLNLADVLLTKAIIHRGGVEGNPIMRGMMAGLAGPVGTKVTFSLIAALLLIMCPVTSRLANRAAATVAGIYVAIVAWNSALLMYLVFWR